MATLILHFDAPMQSWGTTLKLTDHETDAYPSKSGVIGMIASAMGIRRDDDASIRRLAAELRFGVRIDRPGELIRDFQVSEFEKGKKIGSRYYLSDACFLCGLEASRERLEEIRASLLHPENALYLGRRSCPPTINLVGKISDCSLEDTLTENGAKKDCRIILDSTDPSDKAVRDVPVSFSPYKRLYEYRFIKEL